MRAFAGRTLLLAALGTVLAVAHWARRDTAPALGNTPPKPSPSGAAPPVEERAEPFQPSRESLTFHHDVSGATVDTQGRTALDGLDLKDLASFRQARVRDHEDLALFPRPYDPLHGPSRRIYASITPGTKWLGPTPYYVSNPYVLIVMACANHVTPLNLFCPDVSFRYTHRRIEELHDGPSARCWLDRVFDPPYADNPGLARVVMVNAYDAGLHYAHVDLGQSENVATDSSPDNLVNALFDQPSLFHVGKYAANNISPQDRRGWIRLQDRGATTRVHVKLWTRRPSSPASPADMVYVVSVRP